MKTAVLLSGRLEPEDIARSSNLKEQIIEPYKADVFIDTWIPYEGTDQKLGFHRVVEDNGFDDNVVYPELDINAFAREYRPKMMVLDNFDDMPLKFQIRTMVRKLPLTSTVRHGAQVMNRKENLFFMWYKIYKANKLRKLYEEVNRIRYDRIIRMRFDSKFEDFPKDIIPKPKTVYIPSGGDYDGGINDQFVLADSQTMDIYCDLYVEVYRYFLAGISQHPENLLRSHLVANGLNIERFDCKQWLRDKPVTHDPDVLNTASNSYLRNNSILEGLT